MLGLPDLEQVKKISSRLQKLDLSELRYKARRGRWMLKNAPLELFRQLSDEMSVQKDASASELLELTALIKSWLSRDLTVTERLGDLPELGEKVARGLSQPLQRLVARSSDLTRATLAYTRVQSLGGDYRQAQANAPFLMTFHEAKAGLVLNNMSPAKRAALVPFAERIRDAQLKMGEKTSCYNDCATCKRPLEEMGTGGGCCSTHIAQMFRPIDGIYRQLLGERAPVWPTLNEDWSRCGFMGPQGCILPAGTRPLTCVGFYCNDFLDKLKDDGVWQSISPEFAELRAGIRELEFRFNLNRRFLLKNQPQTIHDSSIGYLYDKLLKMYASYDQITTMGVAGVDAVNDPASGNTEASGKVAANPEPDSVEMAAEYEAGLSYEEGYAQLADLVKNMDLHAQEKDDKAQEGADIER